MGVTLPALWELRRGKGAIVATAIHDGQHIRSELHPLLKISAADRSRRRLRMLAIAPRSFISETSLTLASNQRSLEGFDEISGW